MAEVIQDVGIFNVKDELVFVDEGFYLDFQEEEVISIQTENKSYTYGDQTYTSICLDSNEGKYNPNTYLNCGDEKSGYSSIGLQHEENTQGTNVLTLLTSKSSPVSPQKEIDLFTCDKCKKSFKSQKHLVCHMDSHVFNHAIEVRTEESGKRIWACRQCDKTFISRKGSVIHLRTHTGERPFVCQVCCKRFIDGSTLMKHQVIHQDTRPFTCSICRRGFNQKVALQRHEATHTLQPLFTCKYCPKTFLVRSSLEAHQSIHSQIKPYVCRFCPSRFHTLTLQKQHERVHTNERPYPCGFCSKAFKDSGTLFKHQAIHSSVKPYSCPLCSNGFTQKVAVRKHIKTHVLKSNLEQCFVCKVSITNSDELSLHLEGHVLENPLPLIKSSQKVLGNIKSSRSEVKPIDYDLSDLATLCDVAISTSAEYLPCGNSSNSCSGNFSCFLCGMRYKDEKTLNSHLTGVHLLCTICATKFYDRSNLEKHKCVGKKLSKNKATCKSSLSQRGKINKQTVSSLFFCKLCVKSFKSHNGLIIHQRSHSGEKPYACRWCDKAFGDSATRHKHERIHTGERPFKCLICPRAFNQQGALRAHLATHNGTRAFTCDYCSSSFPYATTLIKHIEACHSDSLELACPLCAVHCPDAQSLHSHISADHTNVGEAQLCRLCDSGAFTNSEEICDHLVWHAKQKYFLNFYLAIKKLNRDKAQSNVGLVDEKKCQLSKLCNIWTKSMN